MEYIKLSERLISIAGVFVLAGAVYVFVVYSPTDTLMSIVQENRVLGAVLLGFIMFMTTVIAPLTSLPLVPLVAPFLGPFTTGVACFVGWTLGAVVAFLVGRYYGQPFMAKFIDMKTINKYETYIPPDTGFMLIVLLRMIIPVDVLSYALGIFSTTVSLYRYTLASMVGILWFSFAFAYFGDALKKHNYVLLAGISVASVVILLFSWHYARRLLKPKERDM
jgi:uncharacterized membrane protein YdjX (TVP38/TMEM64 family)